MDITKLKEMEASLIDAKEKAEVANRAKTEFLASMSHDMKTPLAGIVTTAEVIVGDKTAPDRDKQYAAIIAASGKQLASFFTSCLDLSKMEMQEWASKIETFSLKQLVNDVAALFAPQALSKKFTVKP
ncbi:MAG: HAMP domain-containing histidine kinase [Gammaproteobacteria bacterium]|nr:HAMP domain-containing histidine kinase [Gammaproteobacteria bacterium]